MKKIIITAISAIAVIASVVGCQIYDSQSNANLYHNGQKLQDFASEFNNNCLALIDNSSDQQAYEAILDAYISFNEHFWEKTAMIAVKSYVKSLKEGEVADEIATQGLDESDDAAEVKKITERVAAKYNEKLHDTEWCKTQYKNKFTTSRALYKALYDYLSPIYALSEFANYKYNVKGEFVDDPVKLDFQNERDRKKDDAARLEFMKAYKDYEKFEFTANGDNVKWSLAGLWEKTYKLKWDYNSKK